MDFYPNEPRMILQLGTLRKSPSMRCRQIAAPLHQMVSCLTEWAHPLTGSANTIEQHLVLEDGEVSRTELAALFAGLIE